MFLDFGIKDIIDIFFVALMQNFDEVGKHQKPMTEAELELARLRKELAEVKLERDLLKKCAAYFAKESR